MIDNKLMQLEDVLLQWFSQPIKSKANAFMSVLRETLNSTYPELVELYYHKDAIKTRLPKYLGHTEDRVQKFIEEEYIPTVCYCFKEVLE